MELVIAFSIILSVVVYFYSFSNLLNNLKNYSFLVRLNNWTDKSIWNITYFLKNIIQSIIIILFNFIHIFKLIFIGMCKIISWLFKRRVDK